MAKKLKDIINESDDLFFIEMVKGDKRDKSTWKVEIKDSRWKSGPVDIHRLKTVILRRDNYFFLAYRVNDTFNYLVDIKKAMFKTSVGKFVDGQIKYSVMSNDISLTKNEPSFKITSIEMKSKGIDNFLDMCYYFRNYTAIGTGYTRNIRNLIVMDIDVDCTRAENKAEISNLLSLFGKYDSLPNFYIFNKESKHIQLQWLIKDYIYKEINTEAAEEMMINILNDKNRNREMPWTKMDFTRITEDSMNYRRFTMALCEIVEGRRKFGDRNYTFWKAKNPMSALYGIYGLELKMPYMKDGEVMFMTQEEMTSIFSSNENRRKYFQDTPTFNEITTKMEQLMKIPMEKVMKKDSKIEKIVDAEDVSDKTIQTKTPNTDMGLSRNTFVFRYTKKIVWETAKEMGYRNSDSIMRNMTEFRKTVLERVKKAFQDEDKKYGGIWPDTTNISEYSNDEFMNTFTSSYNYGVSKFKNKSYSQEDRDKSLESRYFKKEMRLLMVDRIRNNHKDMTRNEMLTEVNRHLKDHISMSSFKRYLSISKSLDDDKRQSLYDEYMEELNIRKMQMEDAIKENKDQKTVNTSKKRYKYLMSQ